MQTGTGWRLLLFVILPFVLILLGVGLFRGNSETSKSLERRSIGSTDDIAGNRSGELLDQIAQIPPAEVDSPFADLLLEADEAHVPKDSGVAEEIGDEEKAEESETSSEEAMPRITLFNGCGVKGIGARAKSALEAMGYEVVEVRNARNFDYGRSEVLDRRQDLKNGTTVAERLGIVPALTAWDTTRSDRNSDVSLIVGSDYKKLNWKIR